MLVEEEERVVAALSADGDDIGVIEAKEEMAIEITVV